MVHCYKKNGYNIILDVNSGTVHEVDDVAYDMIEAIKNKVGDDFALDQLSVQICEDIIHDILLKYSDMPDIDEAELKETMDDIVELINAEQLFQKKTIRAQSAWSTCSTRL